MRIYTASNRVIDLCQVCTEEVSEGVAQELYGLAAEGPGPDGRGDCFAYDAEHPPYETDDYTCDDCECQLYNFD